jgi:hypothetical protein
MFFRRRLVDPYGALFRYWLLTGAGLASALLAGSALLRGPNIRWIVRTLTAQALAARLAAVITTVVMVKNDRF